MTAPSQPHADNGLVSQETSLDAPAAGTVAGRRLPFAVRVAMVWSDTMDLPREEDGPLYYWRRAPLTGSLASTSGDRDVSFCDLEVR
jgi:hypothetical protein